MTSLPFHQNYGLIRKGVVDSYDQNTNKMTVILQNNSTSLNASFKSQTIVTVPFTIAYNNGLFIGAKPVKGTPVAVVQGEGNEGYFISFLPQGNSFNNFPTLDDNEIVISSTKKAYIKLNTDDEILLGNTNDRIKLSTPNKQIDTYLSSTIDNEYKFGQNNQIISGLVRREYKESFNYVDSSKLKNDNYISEMKIIGMDYSAPINIANNINKNPPFVENRIIAYEFALDANIQNDLDEKNIYLKNNPANINKDNKHNDRRNSRANTLNLNKYNPNSLIEIIQGTVIDIFGNLLDINRNKIILSNPLSSQANNADNFVLIKEQERKTLAYHFETNARKDFTNIADYTSNYDFGKHRSNFSIDIDKEGLFKLNIPASSEKGNIPLLARYINSSALTDEPSGLIFTKDGIDIQLDSFAAGSSDRRNQIAGTKIDESGVISIIDGTNIPTPVDRINSNHIKYGTAYHDITDTCYTAQSSVYLDYLNVSNSAIVINTNPTTTISNGLSGISQISNVISPTITYGVDSGGRSGAINSDGSIDINVGANTVDKQSILLDTQGSIIGNIGRDKRNISTSLSLDGALLLTVGGGKVSGDPRFTEAFVGGVVEIRTINSGGQVHIIRIDDMGVTIATPGDMNFHAGHDMNLTADGNINVQCETLTLQDRMVLKEFGNSI
jgi:hypothetical protein